MILFNYNKNAQKIVTFYFKKTQLYKNYSIKQYDLIFF